MQFNKWSRLSYDTMKLQISFLSAIIILSFHSKNKSFHPKSPNLYSKELNKLYSYTHNSYVSIDWFQSEFIWTNKSYNSAAK